MQPSQGDDEKNRKEQGIQASHLNKWKRGLGLGLPLEIRDEQGFQASHLNKWKCGLGLGLPLDGEDAILTETGGPGKNLSSASAHWHSDDNLHFTCQA